MRSCNNCRRAIQTQSLECSYWVLKPCQHILCAHCFSTFVCDPMRECLVCSKCPNSFDHCYCEEGMTSRHRQAILEIKEESFYLSSSDGRTYLTMTSPNNSPSTIALENDNADTTDTKKRFLANLFAKFNSFLVSKSKMDYTHDTHSLEDLPGETYLDKLNNLVDQDDSLLKSLLTKLAYGDSAPNQEDKTKRFQIFLAAENIRHAKESRGSLLRRIITNSFTVLGEEMKSSILQKLGLCYSRQNEMKNDTKRADQAKINFKTLKLDKHSFVIVLFDNLGFKNRQGFRKGLGYEQYTIIKIIIINRSQLREIKVYGNDENDEDILSRVKKDWENLRTTENGTYDAIAKPTIEDCNHLATNVYKISQAIISGEQNKCFPSLANAKKLLLKDAFRKGKKPAIFTTGAYCGREDEEEDDDDNDTSGTSPKEQVIFDAPMKKDLNKNDTVVDLMNYALEVRDSILSSGDDNELNQDAAAASESHNTSETPSSENSNTSEDALANVTPILENARIVMGGDGAPIIAAQNEMRRSPEFKPQILADFGGFHLMLELYKKRGALFEHTHLRNMFSMTRESLKAQDHVLQPSDPGQAERETTQIHLGIYLSALRSLIKIKRCNLDPVEVLEDQFHLWLDIAEDEDNGYSDEDDGYSDEEDIDSESDDDGSGNDEEDEMMGNDAEENAEREDSSGLKKSINITPDEVVEFMIERSKRNPQAFIVLLDLRFAELIFLLQRSESHADPALYCAALRYAMLLCVNTNATKYVEMMSNFHIDRACMSDAERAIHDTFVLFRTTKNNKTIFSDRSVEWTMRDIRMRLGKYYKNSTNAALTRILMQLEESMKLQGRDQVNSDQYKSKKSEIKIDSSMLEAYVWAESSNLWYGLPMAVKAKPYRKRVNKRTGVEDSAHALPSPKNLYTTDGKPLYGDVLSLLTRGHTKSENYFNLFHVEGDLSETKRGRKQSDLQKPKIDSKGLITEIELALCLDFEVLQKSRVYVAARVKQELDLANEELYDNGLESILPENKGKKAHVVALIEARKILRRLDLENWDEKVKVRIKERYEGSQDSAIDIIQAEINSQPFLTFEGTQAKTDGTIGKQITTLSFDDNAMDSIDDDERVRLEAVYTMETDELLLNSLSVLNNLQMNPF